MIVSQKMERALIWRCSEDECNFHKICCFLCLTDVGTEKPSYFLRAQRHVCTFDTFRPLNPFCVLRKGGSLRLRYGRCVLDDVDDFKVKMMFFSQRMDWIDHHHRMFHNFYPKKEEEEEDIEFGFDADYFYDSDE